jgi:predicted anti-sigma-YlaC factor YlaD
MNCEKIQTLLPEYWAESIPVNLHREVEQHLQQCDACRAESETLGKLWSDLDRIPGIEPSPAVRGRFYSMLDAYRSGVDEKPRRNWFSWAIPAGALAMLAVGFLAGRMASPAPDPQISQLRGEISGLRQMVAVSLLQQQSPADRMRGVSYAYTLEKSDGSVIAALLDTVKSDPSVNVRLAAVDAFRKLGTNAAARKALLDSLKQQDSPLVQIAIIELLVDLNDKTTVNRLQGLALDPAISNEVKERARWAAGQLN